MLVTITRYFWFYVLLLICIIEILLIHWTKTSISNAIKSKEIVVGNANYWSNKVKKQVEKIKSENKEFEKRSNERLGECQDDDKIEISEFKNN